MTVVLASLLFSGCEADIDLNHIDPTAKVQMGIALPLGEFSVRIGDFLGDSTVRQISIREDGVYQYSDTFRFSKAFHPVVLDHMRGETTAHCKLPSEMAGFALAGGQVHTLEYPLEIELSGLNANQTVERLDSVILKEARFTYSVEQNFGLRFDCIKKMTILLPENLRAEEGQAIEMPLQGGAFGEEQTYVLGRSSLSLMKDRTKQPGKDNISNKIELRVRFEIELPQGEMLMIQEGAELSIYARADGFEAETFYGFFKEATGMHLDSTLSVSNIWKGYQKITQLNAPLADPTIDFMLTTGVAVPLRWEIEELSVMNSEKTESQEASFGGKNSFSAQLPNMVRANDPIGARATNTIRFDNENGGIGQMAAIHPEFVSYRFAIETDEREGITQHRIAGADTLIEGQVAVTVPFRLNEGTDLGYQDTLDLDIDQLSIDRLLADVKQIDSIDVDELHLLLTLSNYLPFDISCHFRFYDENYNELAIEANHLNSIEIPGPADYSNLAEANEPGVEHIDIVVRDANLALLPEVRHIEYGVRAQDISARKARSRQNVYPIAITESNRLHVKAALTANVSAYLQLTGNK